MPLPPAALHIDTTDASQRIRLSRYYAAAGTSLLALVVIFAFYFQGALSLSAFVQVATLTMLAVVVFYACFRSGLNLRAADQSLTVPQMLTANLVVLYAMYLADAGRGVLLILLLMAFLFGVFKLSTRALMRYAIFILAGYGTVIALVDRFKPQTLDLGMELLQWLALAVTLPWFARMGGYISDLRKRLRESNVEQRTALERIQASAAELAESQRIAQLGSWTFDPINQVAHWSRETYRLFGISPERPALLGDEFLGLIHPDDRSHRERLIRPALDHGQSYDGQYRILMEDGGVRWVHVRAEPVIDEQGKTTLLRGTIVDITERKSQEQALISARDAANAAQASLRDAIESLDEAFALFDSDDRLIACNHQYAKAFTTADRFEAIAGMTFADLVRASVAKGEVMTPSFKNNEEAWVADRLYHHRNPGPEPREVQLGDGRWMQVHERRTQSGGLVGVRRDVTERRQLEQRQVMEHAVTRLLAESHTVADGMPQVISTICETLGWDCGARWYWDEKSALLRCAETWSAGAPEVRNFLSSIKTLSFASESIGLVRRVWATGKAAWIPDVSCEPGFMRAPLAQKAGLRAAFAFPITRSTGHTGVMEFYTHGARQPDRALLQVTNSIGLQIGQFLARKEAEEQLRQLAHFDFLTSLPNRNLFNHVFGHALARARRRSTQLALFLIDLDGFKQINDTFGHDAGDHLLQNFAQRLRECVRNSDAVARPGGSETTARLGGDEFVVLIDDVLKRADLDIIARRILQAAAKPFDLAGPLGHVTASIGISIYPADGEDPEVLVKCADQAMYRAKEGGKNRYQFFSVTRQPH